MLATFDFSFPAIAVIPLIFAGIGSYLGSYLKKKGENLATHEDLDKLVEQVAAVTRTTKSIEAAISDDVWNKQKRWELKREVLFEAAKRLAEVDDALLQLSSVIRLANQKNANAWEEERNSILHRWNKASKEFQETRLLIEITCEREIITAFEHFDSIGTTIMVKTCKNDFEAYTISKTDYLKSLMAARTAIRKELGIDSVVTLQPNEFSAMHNPDSKSL
jgi:hypothetical protein